MSLEIAIQDNTEALRALYDLIAPSLAAILAQKSVAVQPEPEKVVEEVKAELPKAEEPEPPAPKAKTPKKTKAVVVPEPEPEVEEDPLADFEAAEAEASILPPGVRDAAYYAANVKPILTRLASINTPELLEIIRGQFGVKKADMLPPDQWDDLVTKVNEKIEEHSAI